MRGASVRGALAPGAAAALCFAALFLSAGSSQSRLFWIGTAAVLVAAIGWALPPPTLPRPAAVFFIVFSGFVLWHAAALPWVGAAGPPPGCPHPRARLPRVFA